MIILVFSETVNDTHTERTIIITLKSILKKLGGIYNEQNSEKNGALAGYDEHCR